MCDGSGRCTGPCQQWLLGVTVAAAQGQDGDFSLGPFVPFQLCTICEYYLFKNNLNTTVT